MRKWARDSQRWRRDAALAAVLLILLAAFMTAMALSPSFFRWAFDRHHNVLSWYVRPLFLIPFSLFAYRRSLAGMAATLLLLATSMFWFPAPDATDPAVAEFLEVEKQYLTGRWSLGKRLLTLLVPTTLGALAAALWQRNVRLGLTVLVLIAVLKMTWSIAAAGTAGLSIFVPALVGLVTCVTLVRWSLRGASTTPPKPPSR